MPVVQNPTWAETVGGNTNNMAQEALSERQLLGSEEAVMACTQTPIAVKDDDAGEPSVSARADHSSDTVDNTTAPAVVETDQFESTLSSSWADSTKTDDELTRSGGDQLAHVYTACSSDETTSSPGRQKQEKEEEIQEVSAVK